MDFRWELPLGMSPEETCVWLQDDAGRFRGVEADTVLHDTEQGDLERFDPKCCPDCWGDAGWLPPDFSHCPLCGSELNDIGGWAPDEDAHRPLLALDVDELPDTAERRAVDLPRGADFTFVRLPWRDRLVALDGDSGQVWVWSRSVSDWRPFVKRPTGHHGVPPGRFGALARDSVLVYPTQEGAVWIDTEGTDVPYVDVSDWAPRAAPAWLADCVLMPACSPEGERRVAVRQLHAAAWELLEVRVEAEPKGPPPLPEADWLSRPVVEGDQVHWVGAAGVLHFDDSGKASWRPWRDGFQPVPSAPVLETRDGRMWAVGHAPDERGNRHWAFMRVAVNAAPECRLVDGAFFSAGRLCFRFAERYLDTPWNPSSGMKALHLTAANTFLVPVCALGEQGAVLMQVRDQTIMSRLLEGTDAPVRGELFFSPAPAQLQSLEAMVQFDGRRGPQAFTHERSLYVYDPTGGKLHAWPLTGAGGPEWGP